MKRFSLKTKESFHRNSEKSLFVKVLGGVLISIALLYVVSGALSTVSAFISKPLYWIRYYFVESSAVLPLYLRGRGELVDEIERLKEQIAALSGSEATITRLKSENENFKALFGFAGEERIAAGVIARPPFTPYDVFIIDQGSEDGVMEGSVVYHAEDHAIGYVSAVYGESALVTLFSAPGIETTVFLFGSGIYATAYGEGGGVVRISVPQGISVTNGDVIVLPSLEHGILGKVTEVQSVPTQPEQHAYVTYDTPLSSMHTVAVSMRRVTLVSFEEAKQHVESMRKDLFKIEVPPEFMYTATSTDSVASSTATSSIP